MAYRIKKKENVLEAIRRIADEQLVKALAEIDDEKLEMPEKVHQVRKRCKKLRGLIRLVRPEFESTYNSANKWFRDTARLLSEYRDAKTMLDTYDELMNHFETQINRPAFGSIRRHLTATRNQLIDEKGSVAEHLAEARQRLVESQQHIDNWTFKNKGFGTVRAGLKKTYRRAKKAMKEAEKHPHAETFHEWRKRVKYHWYHCRLLRAIWPEYMQVRRTDTHKLSDLLGDEHDLSVLGTEIQREPEAFGENLDVQAFLGLTTQRRSKLQSESFMLGKRLLFESTGDLASRFGRYWEVWQEQ